MTEDRIDGAAGRWRRGGLGLALGLTLCACAIVGPLTDPNMSSAPHFACVQIAPAAAQASTEWTPSTPAAPTCFAVVAQDDQGHRTPWTGGVVERGRALVVSQSTADSCSGTFTHMRVIGSSNGAGRMELATFDRLARGGHSREVRWSEGFQSRNFGLASIESATMFPGTARVQVMEGSFEPQSLCFRSY